MFLFYKNNLYDDDLFCIFFPDQNYTKRLDGVIPVLFRDFPPNCPEGFDIFFGQSRSFWQKVLKNKQVSYFLCDFSNEIFSPFSLLDTKEKELLCPNFPGIILEEKEIKHHFFQKKNAYVFRLKKEKPFSYTLSKNLLDILFEDDYILVLNKPPGLPVHKGPGHEESLVDLLCQHCPFLKKEFLDNPRDQYHNNINGERPGIVHRLDKDTSGVMVVAKSKKAHYRLSKQFSERKIEKTYWAFVHGEPSPSFGVMIGSIGRDTKNLLKRRVVLQGGKEAYTEYRTYQVHELLDSQSSVNQNFSPPMDKIPSLLHQESSVSKFKNLTSLREKISWIICQPKTGKTHQLRIYFSHGEFILGNTHQLRVIFPMGVIPLWGMFFMVENLTYFLVKLYTLMNCHFFILTIVPL